MQQQSGVATYRLCDWTLVHLATGKPGIFGIEPETAGNRSSQKACIPHISPFRSPCGVIQAIGRHPHRRLNREYLRHRQFRGHALCKPIRLL